MSVDNRSKILLIAPKTFGYEERIIEALERLNYDVYFLSDTIFDSKAFKIFLRLLPRMGGFLLSLCYRSHLKKYENNFFKKILVIRGEGLSEETLSYIHESFSSARKILYLWDNFRNIKRIRQKLKYFGAVYSFDSQDCSNEGELIFRPLFYLDEYVQKPGSTITRYGKIFFVGTLHSNRTKILYSIIKENPSLNFDYYLYCRTPLEYFFHYITDKNLRGLDQERIIFRPMAPDEVRQKLLNSECVLDMQHPSNSGLTIRTFEALAAGAKLITFNHHIMDYDFYNHNMVHVLNFDNFVIDAKFLNKNGSFISKEFYEKYSIYSFLKYILS
jgi:hypothetical protein